MYLEQRRQSMLQLHLSDQQFYYLLRRVLYERFDGRLKGANHDRTQEHISICTIEALNCLSLRLLLPAKIILIKI